MIPGNEYTSDTWEAWECSLSSLRVRWAKHWHDIKSNSMFQGRGSGENRKRKYQERNKKNMFHSYFCENFWRGADCLEQGNFLCCILWLKYKFVLIKIVGVGANMFYLAKVNLEKGLILRCACEDGFPHPTFKWSSSLQNYKKKVIKDVTI